MNNPFIMPQIGYNQPSKACFQTFSNPASRQISPLSTASTSPTSPKTSNGHTRQVRPMYMPAALRQNEFPSKAMPQPKSQSQSEDDQEEVGTRTTGVINLPGLGPIGFPGLSRRSTGDSGKCLGDDWDMELYPEVKGQPSRTHWKVCCRPFHLNLQVSSC